MAAYNRSNSQKVLFVVSILNIVGGALALLMSLLSLIGFAGLSAATTADLAEAGVTGEEAALAGGVVAIVGVIALVTGLVSVIEGILGIRAANDNQKIMPVWILSIISVALSLFSLIASIVNGNFNFSTLLTLAFAGVMLYVAYNIKTEAGK